MAPLAQLLVLAVATGVSAFTAPVALTRTSTVLYENFGIDFAEDSYENTPDVLLGEANYKQWVEGVNDNAFLTRTYNPLKRVRELDLLKATVDAGILSKLEKNGLDLVTIEKLLPVLEELKLLETAGNLQQILLNLVAFFLVEGAPFLLGPVGGALEVGPPAFFLPAAICAVLEVYLVLNDVEVPLVGLPAGVVLGLLLVPLSVVFGGVGVALSSLKSKA
uniref:Uncharacterized protein n=1 Tax=Cyclophora tenuis TaxID=216820 RepID=A0A7S1CZ89_CYCTE|mmetsp:Transcript_14472/g.24585  ORF Transcript_14472/g.24585 Transcript_14472/m.24585 type:complete len:220 (+) Transcript_14472:47-706(+)